MNTSSMLTLADETKTEHANNQSKPLLSPEQPRIIAVELPRRRRGGTLREVELLERTPTGGLAANPAPAEDPADGYNAAYVIVDKDGPTRQILNSVIYGRAVAQNLYFFAGLVRPDELDPVEFTAQMLEFFQYANQDSMRSFRDALEELVTEGDENDFDALLQPLLDQAYFLKQAS